MPIEGVIMMVCLLLGMASSAGLAWCERGRRDRSRVRREVDDWCARERAAMDRVEAGRARYWARVYREAGVVPGDEAAGMDAATLSRIADPRVYYRGDGYISDSRLEADDNEEVHLARCDFEALRAAAGIGGVERAG